MPGVGVEPHSLNLMLFLLRYSTCQRPGKVAKYWGCRILIHSLRFVLNLTHRSPLPNSHPLFRNTIPSFGISLSAYRRCFDEKRLLEKLPREEQLGRTQIPISKIYYMFNVAHPLFSMRMGSLLWPTCDAVRN